MEALPPEILDRIIAHCDHLTSKNLRLVHSALHDAASASVFREIHMGIFKFGLDHLENVALSRLAKHVRSFILYWDFLPILSRTEWESRIDQRPDFQEFFDSCKEDANGEDWFSRAKCWQWYSSLDKYKYSKTELDAAWKAWMAYYRDQRSWTWPNDCARMTEALSRLQHLQRVESRTAETGMYHIHHPQSRGTRRWGARVNETPLWRRLKSEIFMGPDDWAELGSTTFYEGHELNPAAILLKALESRAAKSKMSPVLTLRLHHRHRGRYDNVYGQTECLVFNKTDSTNPFHSVQKLQLNVSYSFSPESYDLGNSPLAIMGFLRSAQNLRVLDLTFGYLDGLRNRDYQEELGLAQIFRSEETLWPMLNHLLLSVNVAARDLINFLRQHRRNLKALELWNIMCDDWAAVLTPIPHFLQLESVYLENLWQAKSCARGANDVDEYIYEMLFPLRRGVGGGAGSIEEYLLGNCHVFPGLSR